MRRAPRTNGFNYFQNYLWPGGYSTRHRQLSMHGDASFSISSIQHTWLQKRKHVSKCLVSEDEQTPTMKDDCSRQKDKERKSRLSLFLTKSGSHENVSPHKKTNLATSNISPEVALQWSESFEKLLKHSDGVETFSQFLRTEFSEENIEFWLACEEYKTIDSETKLLSKAKCIYTVFIESEAPKEVNIDYDTRMAIQKNITQPTAHCFEAAQLKVYSLMKKDSYPRFLLSDIYLRLTRKRGSGATLFRRRSRSCVFNERGEATSEPSAW